MANRVQILPSNNTPVTLKHIRLQHVITTKSWEQLRSW